MGAEGGCRRCLVSVLLLAGYYVLIIGTAAALLLLGVGMLYFHGLSKASVLSCSCRWRAGDTGPGTPPRERRSLRVAGAAPALEE